MERLSYGIIQYLNHTFSNFDLYFDQVRSTRCHNNSIHCPFKHVNVTQNQLQDAGMWRQRSNGVVYLMVDQTAVRSIVTGVLRSKGATVRRQWLDIRTQ